MMLQEFMFYLFAAVIIVFSILTVTSRRILRAATYLLFVLIATAGLYYLLNYQFLAAVQIALYAGGIVVLIIFSILLTSHISHRFEMPKKRNLIAGAVTLFGGLFIIVPVLFSFPFKSNNQPEIAVDMKTIGNELIATGSNGYSLVFEVISILLLAAMIGSIIIAKRTGIEKDKNNDTI